MDNNSIKLNITTFCLYICVRGLLPVSYYNTLSDCKRKVMLLGCIITGTIRNYRYRYYIPSVVVISLAGFSVSCDIRLHVWNVSTIRCRVLRVRYVTSDISDPPGFGPLNTSIGFYGIIML